MIYRFFKIEICGINDDDTIEIEATRQSGLGGPSKTISGDFNQTYPLGEALAFIQRQIDEYWLSNPKIHDSAINRARRLK